MLISPLRMAPLMNEGLLTCCVEELNSTVLPHTPTPRTLLGRFACELYVPIYTKDECLSLA